MIIFLLVLVVLMFGVAPSWGYHSWGWGPSGGVGLLLVILLVLFLLGRF